MLKFAPLFFAGFLALASLGDARAQSLSADAAAIVERVQTAIAAEEALQSSLPPATTDSMVLERLGRLDQAGRAQLDMQAIQALAPDERRETRRAAYRFIEARDRANQAVLATIPAESGWWGADTYGPEAAHAAFMVVQHAGEDWWRRYLPALKAEAEAARIPGEAYAQMADRLALSEQRPQPYGTQAVCEQGRFIVYQTESAAEVDRRRSSLNLPPLADFEKSLAEWPSC